MRFLIIALLFSVVGCATAIPYTPAERCAQDDMTLNGINHESSSASGLAYNNRGQMVSARVDGSSMNVQCVIPKDDGEKKKISDTKKALVPKEEYNNGLNGKKWITGVGYVAYIVPGIVMKFVYDGQYDRAVEKSNEIASQNSSAPVAQPLVARPPASAPKN